MSGTDISSQANHVESENWIDLVMKVYQICEELLDSIRSLAFSQGHLPQRNKYAYIYTNIK